MNNTAIIILNWNGLALTTACLESLKAASTPADVFVLDNGSVEDESTILKQRFPWAHIERSEINLGFSGGNNFMLKRLQTQPQYDYLLLLNQDTTVQTGWLEPLRKYLESQSDTAVVGPFGARISWYTGKIVSQPVTTPTTVDCVVGSCFMMRRTALEQIGLLHEPYFAYYEEADWCVRAAKAKFTCAAVPTGVTHSKTHGFRTYYIARNMVWFMKRHASALQQVVFFWYYWSIFMLERLKKGSTVSDLWRAAKDGWLKHA